jgi:hypothetical protein
MNDKCLECGSINLYHHQHEHLCLDCRTCWMQVMERTIRTSLTKEEFDDKVKKWHRLENRELSSVSQSIE